MSGQGAPQGFPNSHQPLVGPGGIVTRAWLSLLTSLWRGIQTTSTTVANLPAPTTVTRNFVTDSTVQAEGNFGEIVAGRGKYTVPVWADPSVGAWRIG